MLLSVFEVYKAFTDGETQQFIQVFTAKLVHEIGAVSIRGASAEHSSSAISLMLFDSDIMRST